MDRYDVSRMDFEYFYRERERSVVSIFSRFFQIRVFLNYYGIFLATLVGWFIIQRSTAEKFFAAHEYSYVRAFEFYGGRGKLL